jgi:hypothetical protein
VRGRRSGRGGRRVAALRPRRGSLRRRHGREGGGVGDRQRAGRAAPEGSVADPRRLVWRQRCARRGVPARLGHGSATRLPAAAARRRGHTGARSAARGAPAARRGDRRAARTRRARRERRQRPRARPGRPVRLRPGRGGVRRAAAGDPRLGPARLPAAGRARRAREGRLALAAPRPPRRRRRVGTSRRARSMPRPRTTGCSSPRFRRRRSRRATRPARL